ncbi:MAG: SDR family NAD(P)-dependent oxidoreductase [Chloroflexi bacterium]|nr:SDR family NAD(P)-dependent oxidoreductase [Chloroflexota bacterium]
MINLGLEGKSALVTGASKGIGSAIALQLAEQGVRIAVNYNRSEEDAKAVAETALKMGGEAFIVRADVSDPDQVNAMVDKVHEAWGHVDILVNNAGVLMGRRSVTEDGLETTFAVNHLAYFLLTTLLLDRLVESAPARVVNVASVAHERGRLRFDDLQGERRYGAVRAYAQSKLANVEFTYELARRLEDTGVAVNCLDPGAIRSGMGKGSGGLAPRYWRLRQPFLAPEAQGADTPVYLASSPDVADVSGGYWVDRKLKMSSKRSYDQDDARRLWEVSEELTASTRVAQDTGRPD